MKFFQVRLAQIQGKIRSRRLDRGVETSPAKSLLLFQHLKPKGLSIGMGFLTQKSHHFLEDVKSIGFTKTMDDLDRRKLSIFNQLNFFQLVTGLIVPITFLFGHSKFALNSFIIASLPALVSFIVLYFNLYRRYQAGMIVYFILYPVVTSFVYMKGMNLGVELFFILYGILSVFFLQEISHMLFAVTLSMVSYFILAVICKDYTFQLQTANFFFYVFNQIAAMVFIFYGLYLIKKENNLYQFGILGTNKALQENNIKIEKQKAEIEQKAKELSELNSLKNKLFSVIAHDLKSPMYALRNLFTQIQQQHLPLKELKSLIPDVVNDLNYTTGLMDNLLQWAKSQMQSGTVHLQTIDISDLTNEVVNLLLLQATSKEVVIRNQVKSKCYVLADKDMIQLVLRNLLSNAIKFTPEGGSIWIRLIEDENKYHITVQDTGIGMTKEALSKISDNNYYTTKGTSSEAGTGLGIMLCREFLLKNGGKLQIESEEGKGSRFSFDLPKAS
ncbi:MAG: hypothetical protein C5B59_02255 [Bacteroidetes bacterium]|nr:MAG: hypothetical protein C5B59_02255 [Bacteroidota bacterium]